MSSAEDKGCTGARLPKPGEWPFQGKREGLDSRYSVERIEDLPADHPFRVMCEKLGLLKK